MSATFSPAPNNERKKPSDSEISKWTIPSPLLPVAGQKDATYKTALLLVARIDEDLTRGVSHYRTRAGELLTTLDQIVVAILNNDLLEPEG